MQPAARPLEPYPKLLAFLQLIYPSLYARLVQHSSKPDIVAAGLLCANDLSSFQARVFSDVHPTDGDVFGITPETDLAAPCPWDWRWVFALHVMYKDRTILPVTFPRKIIALPTEKYPLSTTFFSNLNHEFTHAVQKLIGDSHNDGKTITETCKDHLYSASA